MKFNTFDFNKVKFNSYPLTGKASSYINIGLINMILIKTSESTAARRRIPFEMVSSSDLMTPVTGLSFSTSDVKVYKNGGTEADSSGSVTEIGGGLYYYECTSTEADTIGPLTIRAIKTGSIPAKVSAQIVSFDPYDAVRIGLTSLPNANANASGGIVTFGTGSGQLNVASGGANINLSQTIPFSDISANTTQSLGDCLSASRANGAGKWTFSGTTLTLYGPDGTTIVRQFTLNDAINPTQRT